MTNQIEADDLTARSYCSIFQVESSWEGRCQHDRAANFFVEGIGGKVISHLEGFPVSLSFFNFLFLNLNLSFCLLFFVFFFFKLND